MRPGDVSPSEMGHDHDIANEELERFLQDLRAAFPAQTPAEAETHLAAMFETAQLLAENGDPVARPVSNADAPAAQVSRLPKRRRDSMTDKKFLRSRATRVLAPVVATFAIFGAMASANALPRTMQHAASTAAGWVGLDVPDTEDGATDTTADDQPDAFNQDEATTDPSTAPDDNQGDDNSQGDSTGTTSEGDQGQGDSTGTTSEGDQGDNSQGDSTGTTSEGDQGDNNQGDDNSQGDSTGSSSGSGSEDNQDSTDTGSQDNNQGDSTGDSGTSSDSGSGSGSGSDSGSGDSQD